MSDQEYTPAEEEIAALARRSWEDEGRPDDRALEHWREAVRQLRERAAEKEVFSQQS